MKFANIIYTKRNERLTIGDDMQLLAIESMYRQMGINYDEVIRVKFDELATYDGEYVLLPISFPLIAYTHATYVTKFSDKIIPVFLGICFLTQKLRFEDIEYLKQFAPIGCRDEYTFRNLRRQGIPAYLNGCMTLTFPRVKNNLETCRKVFCIDMPDELVKYIPEDIKKDCVFSSHTYCCSELNCSPEQQAGKIYQTYIDQAKLVITTRMHAALPCIAAGIPVILMKDHFSYRFAGIDKVVKIYTKDEYEDIDWHPIPAQIEEHKKLVLAVAKKRILETYERYNIICQLSQNLEGKETRVYHKEFLDNTFEFLEQKWSKDDTVNYILWGVTQAAEAIHLFIQKNYPNANIKGVIDKFKRVECCGCISCSKEEINIEENTYILVCTGAAIRDACKFFKEKNIENYYQCCGNEAYNKNDIE